MCVTDFHVHKKQTIIDIRRQNQKNSNIFFDFLKHNAMVHVCGNFVVYTMSLLNFRGGGGKGQNSQQYYVI